MLKSLAKKLLFMCLKFLLRNRAFGFEIEQVRQFFGRAFFGFLLNHNWLGIIRRRPNERDDPPNHRPSEEEVERQHRALVALLFHVRVDGRNEVQNEDEYSKCHILLLVELDERVSCGKVSLLWGVNDNDSGADIVIGGSVDLDLLFRNADARVREAVDDLVGFKVA